MRRIAEFDLIDTRLKTLSADQIRDRLQRWTHLVHGWGTDAESALDHLLHELQIGDIDVGGLECRIKERWNPTQEEGDGGQTFYHLYLGIKLVDVPQEVI